eukprot:s1626_g14.t1
MGYPFDFFPTCQALPDFICQLQIPVGTAGPQRQAPDPSGQRRTSTASSRSQWATPGLNRELPIPVGNAGPQPRAPDPSGQCRTSTASPRSQWAVPDLNRELRIPVGNAGPQLRGYPTTGATEEEPSTQLRHFQRTRELQPGEAEDVVLELSLVLRNLGHDKVRLDRGPRHFLRAGLIRRIALPQNGIIVIVELSQIYSDLSWHPTSLIAKTAPEYTPCLPCFKRLVLDHLHAKCAYVALSWSKTSKFNMKRNKPYSWESVHDLTLFWQRGRLRMITARSVLICGTCGV